MASKMTGGPTLRFFKTAEGVETPAFATEGSACFDLKYSPYGKTHYLVYSPQNGQPDNRPFGPGNKIVIMARERVLVPTGLIFEIPKGYSVRVHPRSGMALKVGLSLCNCEGVIDSDYFHETFIPLINNSDIRVEIFPGERLAQAELIKNLSYTIEETKEQPKQTTTREGGFGSTDKTT